MNGRRTRDIALNIRLRIVSCVHIASVQANWWFHHDEVERTLRRKLLDSLAATATDRGAARQEERNIAAKLGGHIGQSLIAPVDSPANVGQSQRRGRIAGSATQPGAHRDSLHKSDTSA